eukprot:GEMP01034269.1.p1 GENE.GEMP01034269.1~~GEMP01034269.1.p1  ORF type:complete len:245 (+),score=72.43 GEMP01034269.1:506-1240(+)
MPSVFVNTMAKVSDFLERNLILSKQQWTTIEVQKINEFLPNLITTKPVIYLLNLEKGAYITKNPKFLAKVFKWVQEHGGGTIIPFSVELEEELFDATQQGASVDEAMDTIISGLGALTVKDKDGTVKAIEKSALNTQSALAKIIKAGYSELNLIQFFTTGPTEVRSWTVFKGATAPNAAGAIHGDLEKCFIKAEVVSYKDFVENTPAGQKSMAGAKLAGKYRQEGRTYVVQDGDIVHIMHNAKK